jgi:hypothetical protein
LVSPDHPDLWAGGKRAERILPGFSIVVCNERFTSGQLRRIMRMPLGGREIGPSRDH